MLRGALGGGGGDIVGQIEESQGVRGVRGLGFKGAGLGVGSAGARGQGCRGRGSRVQGVKVLPPCPLALPLTHPYPHTCPYLRPPLPPPACAPTSGPPFPPPCLCPYLRPPIPSPLLVLLPPLSSSRPYLRPRQLHLVCQEVLGGTACLTLPLLCLTACRTLLSLQQGGGPLMSLQQGEGATDEPATG